MPFNQKSVKGKIIDPNITKQVCENTADPGTHLNDAQHGLHWRLKHSLPVDDGDIGKYVGSMARGIILAVCRSKTNRAVNDIVHEYKIEHFIEKEGQTDTVNIEFLTQNHKSPGIVAKLKTSSYPDSEKISFKIGTDSNSNILPCGAYKILFPRSTKISWHKPKVKN